MSHKGYNVFRLQLLQYCTFSNSCIYRLFDTYPKKYLLNTISNMQYLKRAKCKLCNKKIESNGTHLQEGRKLK